MPPTRLVIVLHCHQPVGNFDSVFEDATRRCYSPLIEILGRTPSARVGLHLTGPLLEWLEPRRPDLLAILRLLVQRGQIEILGGGMYEPMLAVLPERDALGQIRLLSDECERLFGKRPRGMWLAERVWEPDLARLLALAGMSYTLLDDSHFRAAGLTGRLSGYYVTEKAGAPVAIFPIDQEMRYSIPYRDVPELIGALGALGGQTVTYGDDGEKFGLWPGSHKLVWERGWLSSFFKALEETPDVELVLPAEEIDARASAGRVYLPAGSYEEMGEWALPSEASARLHDVRSRAKEQGLFDDARPFLRGGIWQNFLVKYDEANRIHKKMLRVSQKVAALSTPDPKAVRALYRGQCNCAYWHGLFGGLYLSHLRHALYQSLLEAEALSEPRQVVRAEVNDHDADFRPEIMLETPALDVYVKPDAGASVFEIDYKPRAFCVTNVLGRRREAYHRDIARAQIVKDEDEAHSIHDLVRTKELGLEKIVRHDAYVRRSFVDHVLAPGASLESLDGERYEPVIDLAHARYEIVEASEDRTSAWALLKLEQGGLRVRKAIRVSAGEAAIEVAYDVSRIEGPALPLTFAIESAWTLLGGDDPERFYEVPGQSLSDLDHQLRSRGTWSGVGDVRVIDRRSGFKMTFAPSLGADAWRFPLETVSQSEEGFERNYQGTVLAFAWRAELAQGAAPLRVKLGLRFDPL
ncbi:MAG: DUF1926 domain-containing protein [Deltaproteobacteria bacterium]|nr:DUF1926 domain-containing protein [Deltaproteobacteria bacterium]